ncbi:hypothetical protein [Acetobacterium woodii]
MNFGKTGTSLSFGTRCIKQTQLCKYRPFRCYE